MSTGKCGKGLVWFEPPTDTKGKSAQASLSTCPNIRQRKGPRLKRSQQSNIKKWSIFTIHLYYNSSLMFD